MLTFLAVLPSFHKIFENIDQYKRTYWQRANQKSNQGRATYAKRAKTSMQLWLSLADYWVEKCRKAILMVVRLIGFRFAPNWSWLHVIGRIQINVKQL